MKYWIALRTWSYSWLLSLQSKATSFFMVPIAVWFFLIIPQIFQSQAELNCLLTYTTSVANISPVNINHKKKRKKRVQCLLWDNVPNHTLSDHKKIPLCISGLIGKYMSNQDFWVGLYQSSNHVSRENILKECTMTRRAWSNQPFLML